MGRASARNGGTAAMRADQGAIILAVQPAASTSTLLDKSRPYRDIKTVASLFSTTLLSPLTETVESLADVRY
jgi:hypothetical protein